MPNNIYSKIEPDTLLLSIHRYGDVNDGRTDICPDEEYLQISTKRLAKGTTFAPHRHNTLERTIDNTHEAWIVLEGSIAATFWDFDDTVVCETVLTRGDCAVAYRAGHGFTVLEDNTALYEVKNGPYYGHTKDKTFIVENKGDTNV